MLPVPERELITRPDIRIQSDPIQLPMNKDNSHDHIVLATRAVSCIREGDFSTALRLVSQALAARPESPPGLNALAMLSSRIGREPEALRVLRSTIAAHPADTLTYFHLARLHEDGHRPEEALATLEQFFANAASGSLTSPKLLSSAFSLCDRVQHTLAAKNQEAASEAVQGLRQHVEGLTGYPVVVAYEEMPEDRDAEVTTAWASADGKHLVRCNRSVPPALQPHLLAHQLMRIKLVAEARRADEIRYLVTTPATAPCQLRLLRLRRPQIRRLLPNRRLGSKDYAHAAGAEDQPPAGGLSAPSSARH